MGTMAVVDSQSNLIVNYPDKVSELSEFICGRKGSAKPGRVRGVLIECLHKAQELFGYLPKEVQIYVAEQLDLHHSDVYGVISFYSFFNENPVGKYRINICTGTACFVRGADRIMQEFQHFLHIEDGETTPDGNFSLASLRCVGACSLAPVVLVNEKVYGNVTAKMVPDIINECD